MFRLVINLDIYEMDNQMRVEFGKRGWLYGQKKKRY